MTSSLSTMCSTSSFSTELSNCFEPSKKVLNFQRPDRTISPKLATLRATNSSEFSSISDYLRFKKETKELQTSVVSYRKKLPWFLIRPFLQVDLVSTVHIADREYFLTLQKELESYDCVLYEMVASRETLEKMRIPGAAKAHKGSHSHGFDIAEFIEQQMAQILRLDYQLDCLDYHAENWYHADLDYETFKLRQQKKGESIFTLGREMALRSTKGVVERDIASQLENGESIFRFAREMALRSTKGMVEKDMACVLDEQASLVPENLDDGGQAGENSELEALLRLDISAAMKVYLAKQLTSQFGQLTAEVGEGSVIIGERNKAAIAALERAINGGHNRIAILYGSGHMPDMGRRLRVEFDLIPAGIQWITAWSITNP